MLHIFALACLCLDHCLSDVYSRNHKVSFRECKDWSHCSNLWNTFHLTAVVSSSSLIKITELVRHNKERLKYTAVRSIASKPWENGFQSNSSLSLVPGLLYILQPGFLTASATWDASSHALAHLSTPVLPQLKCPFHTSGSSFNGPVKKKL